MVPIKTRVKEAVAVVRKAGKSFTGQTPGKPEIIITTGSGLGSLGEQLFPVLYEISYEDIPYLPPSRIPGHAGRLAVGHFGGSQGKKVVVLDGRVHGYEGHDPLTQVLPLLIAHELCADPCLAIFTNAAGAINESFTEGQLMLISDHINFTGQALLTLNDNSDIGGTNLDMTFAYTAKHRTALKDIAKKQGTDLAEGVYIGVRGAMFETPAEIRAFRAWGADAVGMSTVHEVVAASRLGTEVVGISVLSNMAAGVETKELTHGEVLDNTAGASDTVGRLISAFLAQLP